MNDLEVPTSIHWHGMHQPGTWQMDGVDGRFTPAYSAGQRFVYEFKATPAGTHWYHSHAGVQYSDGLFGPLIVDEPRRRHYDREEIVFINDWFLRSSEQILAELIKTPAADAAKMDMSKPDAPVKTAPGVKDMAKSAMKMPMSAAGKKMAGMKEMKPGMAIGADIGDVPFESALINGKGRFGDDSVAAHRDNRRQAGRDAAPAADQRIEHVRLSLSG